MKFKLAMIGLAATCIYLLLYTYALYLVIGDLYVAPDGELWWRTSPPGSLFPIPKHSGMLQALSQPSRLDKVIYFSLVKSNVLLGLNLILITSLTSLGLYFVKHRKD